MLLSAEPAHLSGPVATLEDWPKEFRYYTVLRQAVVEHRLPLFVSRPILAGRKLLAIPELNCTPTVALLSVLSIPRYVLVDTLLYYAAGFAGLLLLRRRYALGFPRFAFLFLVFFFNGHLVAHLAVGHSMWAAHFLLPFFVLGLMDVVEKNRPAVAALVMAAVLFRGGIHLFASCVLFLLLLAAFNPRRARAAVLALAGAAVLGAARLAPAAFLSRRWEANFLSGFPSAADVWAALVSLRPATDPRRGGVFGQLSWWEYDTYLGPGGLLLLVFYGIVLARRHPALPGRAERGLYGPMAVMAALSLGDTYLVVHLTRIPLLSAERVSARLLLLPLVVLATLAALHWQRAGSEAARSRPREVASGAALALMAAGIAVHAWHWRIQALQRALPPRRGLLNVELVPLPSSLAGGDLAYVVVVAASAAVSALGLAAAGVLISRRLRSGAYESSPAGGISDQAGRQVTM